MTVAPAPVTGATTPRRRGGPPIWFAVFGIGGMLLGVLLIVGELLGLRVGVPGVSATIPPTGAAAQMTHDRIQVALEAASFQVRDPQTDYRPGESPDLVDVPRRLVQAVLPEEPQGGYVVIYELPDANEADRVGRGFFAYLGSGTGAIQYPRDTQFVLRRVGQTLVFFPWSAQASPNARVAEMAAALDTVGTEVRP